MSPERMPERTPGDPWMNRIGLLVVLGIAAAMGLSGSAAAHPPDHPSDWNFKRYLDEAHSLGDATVTVGADYMTVDWNGIELGDAASHDLRARADGALSGKPDGTVDRQELDDLLFAMKEILTLNFGKWINQHGWSDIVLIDNAQAQKMEATNVQVDGLVGDVEQAGHVKLGMSLLVDFPNVDDEKDLHAVRVDLGPFAIPSGHEDDAQKVIGDLTLTVKPAKGWTIDAHSVQPDCAAENLQENALVFAGDDIQCFTGHNGLLLGFVITGHGQHSSNFLPGFGAVGFGLAALGMGAHLRRR